MQGLFTIKSFHNVDIMKLQDLEFKLVKDVVWMIQEVQIALVGKYTKLEDAYASVIKALDHAALAVSHKLKLTYIAAADLEEETKVTHLRFLSFPNERNKKSILHNQLK